MSVICRLKSQRVQDEKEHQDEVDGLMKKCQDVQTNLDKLQKEMTAKQTEVSLCDVVK